MQEPPFPPDDGRERSEHLPSTLKVPQRPDDDIGRYAGSPQRLVRQATASSLWRSVIRDDDEKIQVAVRPGIAPRVGPEEVDAFRSICDDQPIHDLLECVVHGPSSLASTALG